MYPLFWVESYRMPAEGPSRSRPIPPPGEATEREREVLADRAPLVSGRELRAWRRGRWRPQPPPPLRRTKYGYRGVRVGEAKNPGPRPSRPVQREERLEVKHALKTIESYTRGFAGLEKFLKDNDLPRASVLADLHARDYCSALSQWVRTCYEEGTTREYAVAGLLRFSEL